MNRKSVTAILLVVSIIVNVLFLVFAYIQKNEADNARQEAISLTEELRSTQRQAKAELDECDGMRAQSDQALEDCERKILAISNRK